MRRQINIQIPQIEYHTDHRFASELPAEVR